jgi:TIGR03009 family protein
LPRDPRYAQFTEPRGSTTGVAPVQRGVPSGIRPAQYEQNPNAPNAPQVGPATTLQPLPPAQPGAVSQPGNPNSGALAPGNAQLGQPRPPVQLQPARAPFNLTAEQQAELENVLAAWEQVSGKVNTFQCEFTRWEYDPTWGPLNAAKTEAAGILKYQAPDKGLFQTTSVKLAVAEPADPNHPNAPPKYKTVAGAPEDKEYWLCDGQAMYNINYKDKTMTETALPANMRGKAIADGPLPFVFGQKKEQMLGRYWCRITTPLDVIGKEIWLEIFPKYQVDAANYVKADLILGAKDLMPLAVQLHLRVIDAKRNLTHRTVYRFSGHTANGTWDNFLTTFIKPELPWGYKKIVENYTDPSQPATQARGNNVPVRQR